MDIKTERNDVARFFKAWIDQPLMVGAIIPSGRFLASAIAIEVERYGDGPVIELGSGTGAVTSALIRRGIEPKRLVLVEFNPVFCQILSRRYPCSKIIQGDAYDLAGRLDGLNLPPAEAVISGLPLFYRPVEERIRLLLNAFKFMAPAAPFIQFTYAITSPIPRSQPDVISQPSSVIWRNLPPARVWTYRDGSHAA